MVKTLLKKQLLEIFRSYFYDAKKNKARSRGGTIAYIVLFVLLMVGLLGGMFTFLSVSLCAPLAAADMAWLYFVIMGLLAILLGAFGSVFNTYSGLYLAKDNDLLLSLPIPVRVIMTSRLLGVYLMGLMYSIIVILPAVIVYWFTVPVTAGVILGGVVLMALISLFVLTLSCALGWVVAKISLKLKHKSFVTMAASLLFIAAYYFFYFRAQSLISDLLLNAADYGAKIRDAAYPLYLFGRVACGDGVAIAVVSAVVIALLALVWYLIARSFVSIATASGAAAKAVYREKAVRQAGADTALLRKEFAHFTASPNYMLNCGLGVLLLVAGGVALLFKGGVFLSMLNALFVEQEDCVPMLLAAAICLLASMNNAAAPSISLEGKGLWQLQALPITPWQALWAKLMLQVLLTGIPVAFCVLCVAVIAPLPPLELLMLVLTSLLYTLFYALVCLTLGLKMPVLTWTSEITPIKQSGCVAIALLIGFVYPVLLCGGYLALGWKLGFVAYAALFAVLTLALSAALYLWLKRKGAKLLAAL